MADLYYQVIEKDITNGLKNEQVDILGDGNYIILQYAPSNANVRIRINSNFNASILLRANSGIEAKGIKKIYVECDAVEGEKITFIHSKSSEELRYIPPTFGKLDIGTVDAIKKVEVVEIVNLINSVKGIEGALNSTLTFEKLFMDKGYLIGSLSAKYLSDSQSFSLNDMILELEKQITGDSDMETIDWNMFDFIYVESAIEIRTSQDDPYDINKDYAAFLVRPVQTISDFVVHAREYIDNNRDGAKGQTMHQIYTSDYLKKLTDFTKLGSVEYVSYHPEANAKGLAYMTFIMFNEILDVKKTFDIGDFILQSTNTKIPISLSPDSGRWSGYKNVTIYFSIDGTEYIGTPQSRQGKIFGYDIFGTITDSANNSNISWLSIYYDGSELTIHVQFDSGNKLNMDNLKIEIDGYL
jgi:hypothetical protein